MQNLRWRGPQRYAVDLGIGGEGWPTEAAAEFAPLILHCTPIYWLMLVSLRIIMSLCIFDITSRFSAYIQLAIRTSVVSRRITFREITLQPIMTILMVYIQLVTRSSLRITPLRRALRLHLAVLHLAEYYPISRMKVVLQRAFSRKYHKFVEPQSLAGQRRN
jgi:hypothetical protein